MHPDEVASREGTCVEVSSGSAREAGGDRLLVWNHRGQVEDSVELAVGERYGKEKRTEAPAGSGASDGIVADDFERSDGIAVDGEAEERSVVKGNFDGVAAGWVEECKLRGGERGQGEE